MADTAHRERWAGYALLAAAAAGIAEGGHAPKRWGPRGGAALIAGLAILVVRDGAMVSAGSLRRLRPVPAGLLVAEVVTASSAIAAGARPWLMAKPAVPRSVPDRAGTHLATATFAIHAIRQLIYLSPDQGRRQAPP